MPVKIIKNYKGTNLFKGRLSGNRIKYGYRWSHKGKHYTRCQWDKKEDAETAFAVFRLRTLNPDQYIEVTLTMLLEGWKQRAELRQLSRRRIHETIQHFERFQRACSVDLVRRIREEDLLTYQRDRQKKKRHNHTINKEVAMIRTVLRAASDLFPNFQWKPPVIRSLPQIHNGRDVILSRDELMLIQTELQKPVPESNKPEQFRRQLAFDAVAVGIETAMRISEIVGLEKSQVCYEGSTGFKHGYIVVYSAKTRKRETIPMTKNVAGILCRRSKTNRGRFLFKREAQTVNPVCQKIRRALKNACKRAGINYGMATDGAVFHTIRHSTTTELVVNQKVPIPTVMKITRHSSRTMVMRYIHPAATAVEEAIELTAMDYTHMQEKEGHL